MSNITIDVKNDAMLGRMNDKVLHITLIEQQNEIERLHSIIKEVREYIKNNETTFKVNEIVNAFGIPSIEFTIEPWKKDVLEILDKVGDEK